jgi:hypothetical protein
LERDFKVVEYNGAASKDEVSIWTGEDSSELAQDKEAKIWLVTEELFLLSLDTLRRSILVKVRLV